MSPLRPLRPVSSAFAVALIAGPWPASFAAETPPPADPSAPPVVPAAPTRALEPGAPPAANLRYQTGIEMYVRGDFAGAAREFRVGAALAPGSAKLAYNLARSLERAGDVGGAITEYRRYLTLAPEAADRSEVERVVAVLERERGASGSAGLAQSSGAAAPANPEAALSGRELAAWGCVGGAAVAAVVGAVFTASAVGARDDAGALGPDDTARHAALKDDYEAGRLGAGLGFGVAGGAALAAGLLFFWPGHPDEAGTPVADGRGYGWAWRF